MSFFFPALLFVEDCVILYLPLHSGPFYGKEVRRMSIISNFLLSVAAGIVATYICKWLDEQFFVNGKH